jgi:hypothetical protein
MAKLNTETINRIKAVRRYRLELALALRLSEGAINYNLRYNASNGVLTRIEALRCIKDLLGYEDINQCLDLMANEEQ